MCAADALEPPWTVQLLSRADAAAARGARRAVSSPTSHRSMAGPLTLRSASSLRSRALPTDVQEQRSEAASPGAGQPAPPQPRAAHHLSASTATPRGKSPGGHACRPCRARVAGRSAAVVPSRAAAAGTASRSPLVIASPAWTTSRRLDSSRSPQPRSPQQVRAMSAERSRWQRPPQRRTAPAQPPVRGHIAEDIGWNSPRL